MKTKDKGITLVALIVTIIILLILAGVTILQLTGNGLFTKVQLAITEYKYAKAAEKVALAVNASYDENGKLNSNLLKDNVNEIEGLYKKVDQVTFDLKIVVDEFEFTISEYGKITGEKTFTDETNKDTYLYKSGDECIQLTGGWSSSYGNVTTIDKSNSEQVSFSSNSNVYVNYFTYNKIDLKGYNTIYIEATINKNNIDSGHFCISESREVNAIGSKGNSTGIIKTYTLDPNVEYYEIDISDLEGTYYIGFFGSNRTITIKNIYLSNNISKHCYLINNKIEKIPWVVYGDTKKSVIEQGIVATTEPSFSYGNYMTLSPVDLTKYKKICFIGKINKVNSSSGHLIVTTSNQTTVVQASGSNNAENTQGLTEYVELTTSGGYYEIDISDLNGLYYIGLISSNRIITAYELWLEE